MFLPGAPCGCCGGSGAGCEACADDATQIVIEFETGDGQGVMFDLGDAENPAEYSIECEPQQYTIVLDIGESCGGLSQNEYCLGTVSLNGTPRESNCLYWGGNERESYSFSYGLSPTGRTGTVIGGDAYRIFPEEAAWTFDRINWIGRTRVFGFDTYGFPFFSIIRSWSRQRYRLYRFRSRRPPVVDIHWDGGGDGAEFSANISQHADGLGSPYWKIDSVSVVNGGSGYSPFAETLTVSVANGTGALPSMRVTSMAYTAPLVTVSVSGPSTTPATLAVTLRQQGGFSVMNPPFRVIPTWAIDSVEVIDGGEGYPANESYGIDVTFLSGGYLNDFWAYRPHAFRALIDGSGKVESVDHVPPSIAPAGNEGRGNFLPTASALAVTIDEGPNEIVGLVGVDVVRTRTEPPVVALPPANTSGLALAVSLSKTGSGATAYWSVSSVAVTSQGSGWEDGAPVTFAVTPPDGVEEVAAVAKLNVSRIQPTLTASVAGGAGAVFTVTMADNGGSTETWGVSGVSVTSGGAGYADGESVTFAGGGGLVVVESAQAVVRTGRDEPIVGVGITGTGSGADFSTTITETLDYSTYPARPAWTVSGVTITDGGSGYSVYDLLTASTNGQQSPSSWFYAFVSEVDESGSITAVQLYDGGLFFKSTGIVESVEVIWTGQYYANELLGVTVTNGGRYYSQTYIDTSTPRPPLNCKNYPSGWDSIEFESPDVAESEGSDLRFHPRVGEKYTFKDVFMTGNGFILDFPEIGHTGTRICEDPTIDITIQ